MNIRKIWDAVWKENLSREVQSALQSLCDCFSGGILLLLFPAPDKTRKEGKFSKIQICGLNKRPTVLWEPSFCRTSILPSRWKKKRGGFRSLLIKWTYEILTRATPPHKTATQRHHFMLLISDQKKRGWAMRLHVRKNNAMLRFCQECGSPLGQKGGKANNKPLVSHCTALLWGWMPQTHSKGCLQSQAVFLLQSWSISAFHWWGLQE